MKTLITFVLGAACLLASLTLTNAYDTGHHFDATRNALLLRGFNASSDSINIVELQNFMADWNALGKAINFPNYDTVHKQANFLHFNSLYNSTMIRKYWVQLYNNSYATVAAIINNTMPIGTTTNITYNETNPLFQREFLLLSTMGLILHAHQDFYAHSNWINAQQHNNTNTNTNTNNTGTNNKLDPNQCYYSSGSYDPLQTNEYNLHTYYWPETDSEHDRVVKQYNYTNLTIHGGYTNGINKDSYVKSDFDYSYINAVMQSIDTVDTFKLWITTLDASGTLWKNMMNYKLTRQGDIDDLYYGIHKLFQISAYVKLAWWEENENNGHWKGKGSGDTKTTILEGIPFTRGDWQKDSIFQQTVWNTGVLESLVYMIQHIDSYDNVPLPSPSQIEKMIPPRVVNNPSDFQAVVVRTHQVQQLSGNGSSPDWDGLYAVVGIEEQFFRETPLYSTDLFPWWQSIKLIPKSLTRVSISYDLAIWTKDQDDKEQLVDILPYQSSFIQSIASLWRRLTGKPRAASRDQMFKTQRSPVSAAKKYSKLKHLLTKFRTQEMSIDQFAQSLSGAEQEEIEAAIIVNRTGAFFTFDTTTDTIVAGLPAYDLNVRVDHWPDHQLVLAGVKGGSSARVNITIHTRQLCPATYQTGTIGITTMANTTYQLLFPGTEPNPTPFSSSDANRTLLLTWTWPLTAIFVTLSLISKRNDKYL